MCFRVEGGVEVCAGPFCPSTAFTMDVCFGNGGEMAFVELNLLLVTDCAHDAVHIIDVVTRRYVGYLLDVGHFVRPCGIASTGNTVAVGIAGRGASEHGPHCVPPAIMVFEWTLCSWTFVRSIHYTETTALCNLRFLSPHVIVGGGMRFCVVTGSCIGLCPFLGDAAPDLPWFPMENSAYVIRDTQRQGHVLKYCPCSAETFALRDMKELGWSPCVKAVCSFEGGIIVCLGRFGIFCGTEEVVRRASMSSARMSWMGVVVRGILWMKT